MRFASYPARRVRWWHSGAEVVAPPAACRWPRLAVRRATPSNPNGLAWLVIRFGAVRKSARQRATQLVASQRIAVSSGWRVLPHVAGPAISGSRRRRPAVPHSRPTRSDPRCRCPGDVAAPFRCRCPGDFALALRWRFPGRCTLARTLEGVFPARRGLPQAAEWPGVSSASTCTSGTVRADRSGRGCAETTDEICCTVGFVEVRRSGSAPATVAAGRASAIGRRWTSTAGTGLTGDLR